jgi:hypothetical protein
MELRDASQEEFAALVEAATRYSGSKIVKVAVDGFGFTLTLKSRRYRYDVSACYDPATNHWTMDDPYQGSSLPRIIHEIKALARASQ